MSGELPYTFECPECGNRGEITEQPGLIGYHQVLCNKCGTKMNQAKADETVTDPAGIVHQLSGNRTRCGKNAATWSRVITDAQRMGLVVFCKECEEASRET